MARRRSTIETELDIKEDPLDDIGFDVTFDFRPGQKVLTKFNETGYITSAQVNSKDVHMYYVETGIDKGGWLYPEDFNPIFE